jgi:hypothetical protein
MRLSAWSSTISNVDSLRASTLSFLVKASDPRSHGPAAPVLWRACAVAVWKAGSDPRSTTHEESGNRNDQKHNKQDFGDSGRTRCEAAESEQRCDQRDDEEDHSIAKHVLFLQLVHCHNHWRIATITGASPRSLVHYHYY